MNEYSARTQISRRSWLLAGLTLPLFRARAADGFTVTFDGDDLHLLAPQLHFLTGNPLRRLQDGLTVVFLSQLTLLREDHLSVFRHVEDQLTVSYSVWEENFKVILGKEARSASRLSAAAAEAWCLDNLAVSALGIAPDKPFWLRFDLHAADPRDLSSAFADGISLTGVIEALSRKPRKDDVHWNLEAGPLRLTDLTRTSGRRARNG